MLWDESQILWNEQVMLMWMLLPPVFIFAAALVFAGPLFARNKTRGKH